MAAETGQGWASAALSGIERWWEAGLVPADAQRERPDWAAFAEEAADAAPVEALAPEGDHPGLSGFAWALRPLTRCAGERLERRLSARARDLVDLDAVRGDLERHLGARLARAAARTLVLELHEARTAGRLDGDDSRARFRHFLGRVAARRGLTDLLAGRPVLARILGRAALDAADAMAEALERLAQDRVLLAAGLWGRPGREPGRLVGVEPGAGDGHRGGRSVMLLRFADGTRLVYKPRPLAAHRHFNDLVGWFGRLPGAVELRTLELLDQGAYGWVEFVEARPCASGVEVDAFYRRQGALLALLHLLDGTDLHHENLIAVGAHPVLVDVETLFHPPLPGAETQDPAARALHDSVYRVGLLPQLLVGDHSALDVSAVGGGRAAASPVDRADWADAGTDRMRLVRRAGRFDESANRPRHADGTPVEPGAHVEALCAGFRAAYSAISGAWDELLAAPGPLTAFADDEVRVVLRPTWVYSMLLDETTHPDLLKDAGERQRVLATLRTGRFGVLPDPGAVEEEIAQLWSGDVPLFTARPGGGQLLGSGGLPVGRVGLSGIARVSAKLAALDTVDRQDQEWIVRAAMATASPEPAHRPAAGRRPRTAQLAPEPERLLSAARSLGDRLVSLAYREGPRSNWIGLELLDDRYWRIGPMAADLAGGYSGPALFLAQLAALTGAAHYAEAARTALTPVPALLEALVARPGDLGAVGSGAFSGLGGIAYALAEAARLLDDPDLRAAAPAALRLAAEATRTENDLGLATGAAGGLAALLAAHQAGGGAGRGHLRAARDCADRLAVADLTSLGASFTNGTAGVGWVLLRFADAWSTAGAGGADAVEHHRRAGTAALRAAVGGGDGEGRASAWCRGRSGIALAVLDAPGALDDPHLAAWARDCAGELGRAHPAPDDSLCHGEAGLCELLAHDALPEARRPWVRRAGALLASVEQAGARSGAPDGVPHPGMLTGLAGIGHGLLRAGFPERVPSLLLLRPTGPGCTTTTGPGPGTGTDPAATP
ncbi:type 2 lanthipeptide synthetase LanM family protein [Streptomyces sp. NPDC058739]|uniref:type 2 lanthipeptide synthetase LanM family protein n=1 Tax=Streptomyces sp. NPDC058739 TaxID=3346618 RepID=UPI0036BE581F